MHDKLFFLTANWLAPENVRTLITTRNAGYSQGNYANFNLATHVDDDLQTVIKNRNRLRNYIPNTPFWLNQTHSNRAYIIDNETEASFNNDCDATITKLNHKVCVVLTADCLPILLTDNKASFVAAIHAGWRGVANGIIANTLAQLSNIPMGSVLAFIGPAICQKHFEIGQDVADIFYKLNPENKVFLKPHIPGKFYCNLQAIARLQLIKLGLKPEHITIAQKCTVCDNHLFYSYRKDKLTGRFASLIWLDYKD